jgi:2-phospho-L-lactate/phosphoenolpyruvate guanylyltransferase
MRAVVPLKEFARAKQRLAGVLCAGERHGLMRAMVTDVLAALRATPGLGGILLVSREPAARQLADEFGTELYAESARSDLSEAVQAAGGYLMANHRASGTMIVPADVPLATAADFAVVMANHRQLTLVPDNEGDGTNCIVSTPPNLIRYQFDGHSFRPHLDAAYAIGLTPRICRLANLGLDIDTPNDLMRFLQLQRATGPVTATARFLDDCGIAMRLTEPHNAVLRSD